MAAIGARRAYLTVPGPSAVLPKFRVNVKAQNFRRSLRTESYREKPPPDFAFAFDIDGVLLRSSNSLPGATRALSYLQSQHIPFILLTNGGGTHEEKRVAELSKRLEVPLSIKNFVQSHTPFTQLVSGEGSQLAFKDKCVLVVGGEKGNCREVAENYGFTNVVLPADLITSFGALWPFAGWAKQLYSTYAKTLDSNRTLSARDGSHGPTAIKIDAILVFNDPRDWALDAQIILDLLMSHAGYLGSLSSKNGETSLPNNGWQQDDQPPLYFSNPDLFWASTYHLPRMGQGAFREAFKGLWNAVTGGPEKGVELKMHMFGKPYQAAFDFAEKKLQAHRNDMWDLGTPKNIKSPLKKVYMIGDNPESDILGANSFRSETGSEWTSILVRSGVYNEGEPAHTPKAIKDNVWDAIEWGLKDSGWRAPNHVS